MSSILDQVKTIFQDENFLCIDKPQGLVMHSDGRTEEISLVNWIEEFCRENNINVELQKNIGRPHTLDSERYIDRWGMVNRLDRDTSGLVLIAKNQETFTELQDLFQSQKIKKTYQALVWGQVDFQEKTINQPITRHKKDPRIWTCGFTSEEGGRETGREAETWITVDYPHQLPLVKGERSANMTRLTLIPKTGRTHQLRLHCRFIGHPIVGDDKYGINGKINEHSTRQIQHLLEQAQPPTPLLRYKCALAHAGGEKVQNMLEVDKNSKLKLMAKSLEFELFDKKFYLESDFLFL